MITYSRWFLAIKFAPDVDAHAFIVDSLNPVLHDKLYSWEIAIGYGTPTVDPTDSSVIYVDASQALVEAVLGLLGPAVKGCLNGVGTPSSSKQGATNTTLCTITPGFLRWASNNSIVDIANQTLPLIEGYVGEDRAETRCL